MSLESISEFFRSLWGVWLMILFLGIVFYAYRPRNKRKLEEYGDIPFRDENDKER